MPGVKAEKLDLPLGAMLLCLGLGQLYDAYSSWQSVEFIRPALRVIPRLMMNLMFITDIGVGLLGLAAGFGICRRAAWAWSVVRWAGGACIAASAVEIYILGPGFLGVVARSIENGYPRLALWAAGTLALDVFGVLVWGAACGVVVLREPSQSSEGRRRLRTIVRMAVSFCAMLLLDLATNVLFGYRP